MRRGGGVGEQTGDGRGRKLKGQGSAPRRHFAKCH